MLSVNCIEKKEIINKKNEPNSSHNSDDNTTGKIRKEKEINKNIKLYKDKEAIIKYLKVQCPEFFEKFELLDFLNSGGFGSVMTALPKIKNDLNKKQQKKIVAIKFLNFSNSSEKNEIKHSEILIHGTLKHKNIPPIYGYYKIKENSCIVMNYEKYGDLEHFRKKVIKNNYLSQTFLCYILGGLCEAVYYIHTHNKIIHMDIKQQNILIDEYLNIKLTDYSVSINYKNLKKITLPKVGTCYYMSPEVLNKETISVENASKIDVYSIGVLLYRLAFNDYPFNLTEVDCKNYPQIALNIKENELKFPKDEKAKKPFLNLLKHCLDKDINKRYNINQLMNDPWYKGYQIILNEKEKLYSASKFVVDLLVDNIREFNEYIKNLEKKEI